MSSLDNVLAQPTQLMRGTFTYEPLTLYVIGVSQSLAAILFNATNELYFTLFYAIISEKGLGDSLTLFQSVVKEEKILIVRFIYILKVLI